MTNKKKILLGSSDFKEMIESNAYYIDKSLFIRDVIDDGEKILLLPRPRRFGKTLNLSMLRYFFDILHPENKALFTNLQIWQCDENIKSAQGKYPVIYLSLRDAKGDTWKECFGEIKQEISRVFRDHDYLLDSSSLRDYEKEKYKRLLYKTADKSDYKNSLRFLCDCLYYHYNQRVVILMDEYDAPIQSAYGSYYKKAVGFMRALMSGAYKDNSNLFKGVVTGILRVSKESIFSGLNNIGVYSILQNRFTTSFGFTEAEVKELINYLNLNIPFDEVKSWYNGYKFGKIDGIYNPWSILKLAMNWEDEQKFNIYWVNTSSNDLIKREIRNKQNSSIREDILKLIEGGTIEKDVEENFVFPELETRKNLVWTLFVYSGYLTVVENIDRKKYALRIPNNEVRTIFQDTIQEWFEADIRIRQELEDAIEGLLNNNLNKFEKNLKKLMFGVFSYHDTGKNKEYVYHAYLLGIFAFISSDYVIKSNRESGTGRYDVMLMPKDKTKNGIIIETKRLEARKPKEKDLDFQNRINKEIKSAKNQIEQNKYYQDLIDFGVKEENIVKVPIVFAGKEPYVNELKIKNEE